MGETVFAQAQYNAYRDFQYPRRIEWWVRQRHSVRVLKLLLPFSILGGSSGG